MQLLPTWNDLGVGVYFITHPPLSDTLVALTGVANVLGPRPPQPIASKSPTFILSRNWFLPSTRS